MCVLVNEYGVIGHCEPLVIDPIDYVDIEDIKDETTIGTLTVNEPATFHADIAYIDPDLWEKAIGPYVFARLAAGWAYLNRKDLFYRCRNNKRLRICRKYYKYIIRAYKDHLRGKKNAKNSEG